jgi:hypothetical protein
MMFIVESLETPTSYDAPAAGVAAWGIIYPLLSSARRY